MSWHSPLDLQYWLLNVFAGSTTLFLAIAFLFIAMMAGMFRMSALITGIMFGLFVIMMSIYTGNLAILVLVLIGIAVGWSIVRITR